MSVANKRIKMRPARPDERTEDFGGFDCSEGGRFKGAGGSFDYVCSGCDRALLTGFTRRQLQGSFIVICECGARSILEAGRPEHN